VTVGPTMIAVGEVRIGDRLRTRSGIELTVTRVDDTFLGRTDMLAFVEDTDDQWLKMPAPRDGEVELIRRSADGA
jgi:hypothetical protein